MPKKIHGRVIVFFAHAVNLFVLSVLFLDFLSFLAFKQVPDIKQIS